MANPRGTFDETGLALGWFDETAQAAGWFDGDLLDEAAPASGITPLPSTFGKNAVVAGSTTYTIPVSVSVGDLIVVSGQWFDSAGAVSPAAGDLTKTAGTATIDTPTLDLSDERVTSATCGFGIWSCLVTGAGTLTLQLAPGGDYTTMEVGVFSGSWDALRVEDTSAGFSVADSETSHPSGNATSAGEALFVGTLATDKVTNDAINEDAAFTLIAEEQDGVNFQVGSASYRIVTSGTTDSSDYTSTGNNGGWLSGLVVYRQASGGYTMTAESGTYNVTGQAAGLRRALRVIIDQGAYVLSGQIANLKRGLKALADQGSYAHNGQVVNFSRGYRVLAAQGSYTHAGQVANLRRSLVVIASQGTFTYSGQSVNMTRGFSVVADQGSYAVNGQSANLRVSHVVLAAQGSYSINGQVVAVRFDRKIVAAQGSYNHVGQDVALTKSGGPMVADQGAYSWSGQSVGLRSTHAPLAADQGSYSHNGQAATLRVDRRMSVEQGAFSHNGQPASLTRTARITGDQGSFVVNGQNATMTRTNVVALNSGSYSVTGLPVVMIYSNGEVHDALQSFEIQIDRIMYSDSGILYFR